MSDTLRQAAQQALEYLDAPSAKLWPAGTQRRIITALRAALAEPEPFNPDWDRVEALQESLREHMEEVRQLREQNTMLDAKLGELEAVAEPVQEPVAIYQWRKQMCADWYDGHPDHEDGGGPYETRTLYAAPPKHQREPLSEVEILRLQIDTELSLQHKPKSERVLHFARAIEKSHNIGASDE